MEKVKELKIDRREQKNDGGRRIYKDGRRRVEKMSDEEEGKDIRGR